MAANRNLGAQCTLVERDPCKVVLTFESVKQILKRDHSNESYPAVLPCGTVYYNYC